MLKYLCTNCRYIYNPYLGDEEQEIEVGTDFSSISEDWYCPVCSGLKDDFIELIEQINIPGEIDELLPQEEQHTPFYREEGNKVLVKIGTEYEQFVQDDVHFVEYIGIYDEYGEEIDIKEFPDIDEEIEFDLPNEDYEIRASCTLHGVWKGIKIEQS